GLRINPKGTKTWQVMLGEKRQRITLGHYPDMSLKEARKLALKALAIGEAPPKRSTELTPYPASAAVAKYIEIRHANSRPRYAKDEQWVLSRH
ncbi:Arm DNA-binding domain-containing protein, partial [Streptomyces galilaeus]|uniref:Arm DNA-binding domain-containing protein n=1 Tax=Streptomyces galilaeus TaxID=33899 RepID=UPI0038F7A8BA